MIDVIKKDHIIKRDNAYRFFNENFNYTKLTKDFISNI